MMCCSVRRLQGHLKTMDHETEIMEDWREKRSFLKSELDAADEIIQQGKNAKSPEEIENCYFKLKVYISLMWNIKGAL